MVRVFDHSEIWDRVQASWRRPPSRYRLPDVETWGDGCTCDEAPPDETDCCDLPASPVARGAAAGQTGWTNDALSGELAYALDDAPFASDAGSGHEAPNFGDLPPTNGMSSTGPSGPGPCRITKSEPPPETLSPGSPDWVAWWEGCVPNQAVGPGVAAGCDLDAAWAEALTFCDDRCAADTEDPSSCNDNFVYYAWVDEHCNVVDATCGYVLDAGPGWPGGPVVLNWLGDTSNPVETQSESAAAAEQECVNAGGVIVGGWMGEGTATELFCAATAATSAPASAAPPTPGDPLDDPDLYKDFYEDLSDEDKAMFDSWHDNAAGWSDEKVQRMEEACSKPGGTEKASCMGLFAYLHGVDVHEDEDGDEDNGRDAEGGFMDPIGDDDPCGHYLVEC